MTQPPKPLGSSSSDEALAAALQASRAMHDAPEALVQRALGLWTRAPLAAPTPAAGLRERLHAGLRELVATLAFDSLGLSAAAAGLRSSGPGAARQLLFTAEGRDIDLRISPTEDGAHWVVSGQVLGPETDGHATLQAADGAVLQDLPWNELAEFHFAAAPARPCVLVLRSAGWTLTLPLPPGAPPPPSAP